MTRSDYTQIIDGIVRVLTDDLRKPKYRGNSNPLVGHCYVASEAIYHLVGGQQSKLVPYFIRHEGEPHWFLASRYTGQIVDPTAGQFTTPVSYWWGVRKGFLTKYPSKRAKIVMERYLRDH